MNQEPLKPMHRLTAKTPLSCQISEYAGAGCYVEIDDDTIGKWLKDANELERLVAEQQAALRDLTARLGIAEPVYL